MTLKVVIVGCGKIADAHVAVLRRVKSLATLAAVCDIEPIMVKQLAVRFGIPQSYTNFNRMLEIERPDVVHITTPPASHLALASLAFDHGVHVFCEKPLALDHQSVEKLIDHAQRARRKLTVGWEFFFDPPALAIRDLVERGVLGDIRHVDSAFGFDRSGQFGDALLKDRSYWVHDLPGKLFHNIIDHLLNKMLEFIDDDDPPIIAQAFCRRSAEQQEDEQALHDELRLMILGQKVSGFGLVSVGIRPVPHFLRVYGSRNTLHADFTKRSVILDAAPRFPSAIGRLLPAFADGLNHLRAGSRNVGAFAVNNFHYFEGMKTLVTRFYQSILYDRPPPIPYASINRLSRIMDKIFHQIGQ